MKLENLIYDRRLVAFIDILGFSQIVRSLATDPELYRRVVSTLRQIGHLKTTAGNPGLLMNALDVSVFSDSIVISCAPTENNAAILLSTCGDLQGTLLMSGILMRGGLATGLLHHEEDMIFGEGMLTAYDLESTSAIYPRIIMTEEVVKLAGLIYQADHIEIAEDGFAMINPFSYNLFPGNAEELAADGYDPYEAYFYEVASALEKGMRTTTNPLHRAKWEWIVGRFNRHIESTFPEMLIKRTDERASDHAT